MLLVVLGDVRTNLCNALLVRCVLVRFRPRPAGVKRTPRRTFVGSSAGAVAALAKTVANFEFVVPKRLKPIDQQIFGGLHPRAAHHEIAAVKVAKLQVLRARKATVVLLEPNEKPGALLLRSQRVQRVGVGS